MVSYEAPEVGPETTTMLAEFLYREATLLDNRAYEDWLSLFSEECLYSMPGEVGPMDVDAVPLINDRRSDLEDRVARMRSSFGFAQRPPTRTCRIISNVTAHRESADLIAKSVFVLNANRLGATISYAGRYVHRLETPSDGILRIRLKEVRLLNAGDYHGNITFIW